VRQGEEALPLLWFFWCGQGVCGGGWTCPLMCSCTLLPRLVTMLASIALCGLPSSLCYVFVQFLVWLIVCLFVLWFLVSVVEESTFVLVLGASRTGERV